jgi:signal transduction histidine kinase/CheY-like chemotaxis protein/ABC-type amino acid transport substrate-binding protein
MTRHFILLLVLLSIGRALAMESNPLELTAQEINWLNTKPTVSFTGDPQWLPYEAFEADGRYIGIVSHFIKEFSAMTGVTIRYVPSTTWKEAIKMAATGQVDLISSDLADANIKLTHTFTHPYIENSLVILSSEIGNEINDLNDLRQRRIGIVRHYGYTLDIRARYPNSFFVEVDNVDDGMRKVASKQIDYFIETYAISQFHLASQQYPSVRIRGRLPITMNLGIAVTKQSPLLLSVLNKWIDHMSVERRYELAENWYLENAYYFARTKIDWISVSLLSALLLLVSGCTAYIWHSRRQLTAKDLRFKQALDAVKAGEWEFNLDTHRFYISPLFLDSLPIHSPATIEQLNDFLALVAVKHQRLVSDNFRADRLTLNQGVDLQIELAQDATCWIAVKGTIIEQAHGVSVIGTMSDISEFKHIEQQSAQHEKLITALFDALPDLVILKNAKGSQIITNRVYGEYFGDRSLDDVIESDYLPQWRRHEADAVALKAEQYFSGWLKGKEEPFYFDITLQPFLNEDNAVDGILSVARDMTDTFKLTQELEQFRRFAEYSQQGFGIASFDTNIKYINPKLSQWLLGKNGLNPGQLLSFMQCYPEAMHRKIESEVMPTILEHGSWQGELDLKLADGTSMPTFETFFLLRDEDGTPRHIGGVVVDITQQKLIEESLDKARQQAERANASKSMFLANMSHEIRTPLNAVLGYSQLLIRSETMDSESKSQVERIYGAGQRLLHLINDILDLSKIEAGKLKFNNSVFDLADEVADVIKLCHVKASNKQLTLSHQITLSHNEKTIADKAKIGQVLLNLIDNAIKFTVKGNVTVKCWREHRRVYFEVCDTGVGISEEEQQTLFQPFTQGQGGVANGGTGLGLVLSKRIIDAMGGEFSLHSQLGLGTTVSFNLELETITAETEAESQAYAVNTQFRLPPDPIRTALIIEDDSLSQDLLNQMLQRMGFVTHLCDDGEQGLHYLQTESAPDIIFTDIRMPNLDGIQLLNLIRKTRISDSIPIVAVSASSLEHEKRFYLEHGFSDFVAKPVDYTILVTSIARNMNIKLALVEPTVKPSESGDDGPKQTVSETVESIEDLKRAISEAAAFGDIETVARKVELLTQSPQWRERKAPLETAMAHYDFDRILTLIS